MEYNMESEGRENWELSKENIQPLSTGRRVECISQALNSVDNHEDHEKRIIEFESEIKNYKGDDPLDPWIRYISFLEQASLSFSIDSKKFEVIKGCVQKFISLPQYKDDKRFVEIFIQSTANISSPAVRAKMLTMALVNHEIGTKLSRMYIAIAENHEVSQQYPKAVEILKSGIEKMAHPVEYLEDGLTQLQYRVSQKLMADMNGNGTASDLRSFGDSVPVYGPGNDAPSIRMHLPPAVPTQSKPATKKDLRRVDLYNDANGASNDEKLLQGSLTSEADLLLRTKNDKENHLEPSKWNKVENTIPVREEFCPPTRAQNPIQLYVDEAETQNVVEARKKPVQGVLTDRTEKAEFKKPNDITAPNVKICYRKDQLFQGGKEITFEHFRAMEYRKRMSSTATEKVDSAVIKKLQLEIDRLLLEKESLKQEIVDLKQYRDKADFDRNKLLQQLAGYEKLEIHSKELESDNKELRMHLNSLDESYHNLNNERDCLLKELGTLNITCEKIRAAYENERSLRLSQDKQMQVDMANWKTDMYEQIRNEEETRVKKEFHEANALMKAEYEDKVKQVSQELANMLESERQNNKDLEKKYKELLELKNTSRATIEESAKNRSDSSITHSEQPSSGISHVNVSTSMCSDSKPCQSSIVNADMVRSISNTSYTNSALLGSIRDRLTNSTVTVANDENVCPPIAPVPIIESGANPVTKTNAFLEPKTTRAFKLPKKVDHVSKMAPFSLYESHCETLNQGNSICQDGFSQKPKPMVDFRNLPENRPVVTDLNDENKVSLKAEVRNPLTCVSSGRTSLAPVKFEEQRDDDRIMGGAMCNEKTMDFNITNNLTRALAVDRPLLMSTPEDNERRSLPRRKSMGRMGRVLTKDISMIENETSVYVGRGDFSDDDDCETAEPEYKIAPQNQLNFTEAPIIQNLSTIQETSKENRSAYTTSSSSGSNMTNTNMTRGFASMSNFTRSGSLAASASVSRHYVNQSNTYNNY